VTVGDGIYFHLPDDTENRPFFPRAILVQISPATVWLSSRRFRRNSLTAAAITSHLMSAVSTSVSNQPVLVHHAVANHCTAADVWLLCRVQFTFEWILLNLGRSVTARNRAPPNQKQNNPIENAPCIWDEMLPGQIALSARRSVSNCRNFMIHSSTVPTRHTKVGFHVVFVKLVVLT